MIILWLATGLWLAAARAGGGSLPTFPPVLWEQGTVATSAAAEEIPPSLLALSDDELVKRVESDPASLGSLSIGTPGGGILINAVNLPAGSRWEIAPLSGIWGTSETIAYVQTAIDKVHELFPESPPLFIGDISDADGGRLKRHATHQAGRDVDFGFYYKGGKAVWYIPGTATNLDLPRNWALVRALVLCTDVETILLDTRIQGLLYRYALTLSEDKNWLDRIFQFSKGAKDAVIRHVTGHRSHYHVRFFNPVAQELGRRAYPFLIQFKKIQPPVFTVPHVVRSGETLGYLAARYGTTARAIQRANGLATALIRTGRTYRIPLRGASAPPVLSLVVPARMLPPRTPEAMASATWPTAISLYADRLLSLAECPGLLRFAFRRI